MGELLLFPKPWRNSKAKEIKLEEVQDLFRETNASMYVDAKYNKYEYVLRRQMLAQRLRDKWKVIKGFKEETVLAYQNT